MLVFNLLIYSNQFEKSGLLNLYLVTYIDSYGVEHSKFLIQGFFFLFFQIGVHFEPLLIYCVTWGTKERERTEKAK